MSDLFEEEDSPESVNSDLFEEKNCNLDIQLHSLDDIIIQNFQQEFRKKQVQTLKLTLSTEMDYYQFENQQLIKWVRVLQKISITDELIIQNFCSNICLYNLIHFAFQVSKFNKLNKFSLSYNNHFKFSIIQNQETQQSIESQLEQMSVFLKDKVNLDDNYDEESDVNFIELYLPTLINYSYNIKLFLDFNWFKFSADKYLKLPVLLENCHNLTFLDLKITMHGFNVDKIQGFGRVLSSIKNLKNLNLAIEQQNVEDEKQQLDENQVIQIRQNMPKLQNIENVEIKTSKFISSFLLNILFEQISNLQHINLQIPHACIKNLSPETSELYNLQTFTCYLYANTDKDVSVFLAKYLQKCKQLKKLIIINIISSNSSRNDKKVNISQELCELACKKEVRISFENSKCDRAGEFINQLKELVKLKELQTIKFDLKLNYYLFNFLLKEIKTLTPFLSNLTTLVFDFRTQNWDTWKYVEQKPSQQPPSYYSHLFPHSFQYQPQQYAPRPCVDLTNHHLSSYPYFGYYEKSLNLLMKNSNLKKLRSLVSIIVIRDKNMFIF